jgi:hypothetical protein
MWLGFIWINKNIQIITLTEYPSSSQN